MDNKWVKREQKLLQRKKHKDQTKFFNDLPAKKKKTKKYLSEHGEDISEGQFYEDDDLDIYD